jgi:hypothetical protein
MKRAAGGDEKTAAECGLIVQDSRENRLRIRPQSKLAGVNPGIFPTACSFVRF